MFGHFAGEFTTWYPVVIFVAFWLAVLTSRTPDKVAFSLRAMVALIIAVFLAHLNRIFYLYPPLLEFPSGHTTMCFGLALSIAMLRPWTLAITLPLLAVLGVSMVFMRYHTTLDILGAIPLVLIIYGILHRAWRLPSDLPLLDRFTLST